MNRPTAGPGRIADPAGWLVLIAAAAHLLLPWLLGHLPYQDIANHLARYSLMERAWTGRPAPWIRIDLIATPYIAVDLLGAALVHLVGPHLAVRIIATLALALPPIGMYRLLRAVAPAERVWTLLAVLLSASPFFLKGLINYQFGIGAMLLWAAAWWPRRDRASGAERAGLLVGMLLLVLIHLAAAGVALLLVAADAVLELSRAWRPGSHRAALAAHASRLLTAATVTGAALLMIWGMRGTGPAAQGGAATIVMHSVPAKLAALTEPFYTLSPWEMGVTLTAYLLALVWYVRTHRGPWRWNAFTLTTASLILLFLITPESVGGASHLDVRWLLPLMLLVFVAAPGSATAPRRAIGVVLCAACLVHAAIILVIGRRIDLELNDMDAVLSHLPAGARLLPLVGGPSRHGRVEPYLHYALWRTADTGDRVGGLFSYIVEPAGAGRVVSAQFAHIRELTPPFALFDPWRRAGAPRLPWDRVRQEYDYLLQAGEDSALAAMLAAGACPIDRVGAVTLLSVAAPCASGSR